MKFQFGTRKHVKLHTPHLTHACNVNNLIYNKTYYYSVEVILVGTRCSFAYKPRHATIRRAAVIRGPAVEHEDRRLLEATTGKKGPH